MALSPTKITTYDYCQVCYLLRYYYKLNPIETPRRIRGRKVHESYCWFHHRLPILPNIVQELTNSSSKEVFKTFYGILLDLLPGEIELCSHIALTETHRFQEAFQRFPDESPQYVFEHIFQPVIVETPFLRPYDDDLGVSILAVPDAIYRGDKEGEYILEDRKTGTVPSDSIPPYIETQLLVQALAFVEGNIFRDSKESFFDTDQPQSLPLERKVVHLSGLYLDDPKRLSFTPEASDYERIKQQIVATKEEIRSGDFSPSKECSVFTQDFSKGLVCGFEFLCADNEFLRSI